MRVHVRVCVRAPARVRAGAAKPPLTSTSCESFLNTSSVSYLFRWSGTTRGISFTPARPVWSSSRLRYIPASSGTAQLKSIQLYYAILYHTILYILYIYIYICYTILYTYICYAILYTKLYTTILHYCLSFLSYCTVLRYIIILAHFYDHTQYYTVLSNTLYMQYLSCYMYKILYVLHCTVLYYKCTAPCALIYIALCSSTCCGRVGVSRRRGIVRVNWKRRRWGEEEARRLYSAGSGRSSQNQRGRLLSSALPPSLVLARHSLSRRRSSR